MIEYFAEAKRALKWLRGAPKPEEHVLKRVQKGFVKWSKLRKARLGAVAVVGIVLLSSFIFSAQFSSTTLLAAPIRPGGPTGPGTNHNSTNASDSVGEDSQKDVPVHMSTTSFKTLTIILSWTDEPSSTLQVNRPDSLGMNILAPNGMNVTLAPVPNPQGGTGRVPWAMNDTDAGKDFGPGDWKVTVVGGTMGDYTRPTGRACFVCPADSSNQFTLAVDYTY